MPITLCCLSWRSCVVLIGALTLLVMPPGIFKPDAFLSSQRIEPVDERQKIEIASPKNTFSEYFDHQSVYILLSTILLGIGLAVYLYEWINRKLMARRILKMRVSLGTSLERLRETDARRLQLEGTLKLARGAAAEYNLLLFLLLRKHKEEPGAQANYI